MEDVERGRQREQDELYRDDHEGGRRPDVPMGDRVQDDVSLDVSNLPFCSWTDSKLDF